MRSIITTLAILIGASHASISGTSPGEKTGEIVLSGVVVAPNRATLGVRFPARIISVSINENERVTRGQILVRLDDTEQRGQLEFARAGLAAAIATRDKAQAGAAAQRIKGKADVETAQSGLDEARHKQAAAILAKDTASSEAEAELSAAEESVEKARVAVRQANKTAADLETLDKVGGVSRNDLQNARIQVHLAQLDLDSAEASVDRIKKGSNGVPYRVALALADLSAADRGVKAAEAALRTAREGAAASQAVADRDARAASASALQARAGVTSAEVSISSLRLMSPLDGVVTSLNARNGEIAQPGASLVSVASLKTLKIDALVLTRDISRFPVGKHVVVSTDTDPDRTLDAVVSGVSHIAESDNRSIRVVFRLKETASLRPGQSVKVTAKILP